MNIKAKFIGSENDILGYIPGKEYKLMLLEKGAMTISKTDGEGMCQYQSLSAFLRNWTDISHEDKIQEIESDRGCCGACGEGYDNEEEWKYNTKCGCCGSPIPKHLIIKKQ